MSKYRAILFDLFGTVALLSPEKLPLFEWNRKSTRSTVGALWTLYEQKLPDISFDLFFSSLTEGRSIICDSLTLRDRFTARISLE